jgi:hypothetical protein
MSTTHEDILARIIVLEDKVNSRKLPAMLFFALAIQTMTAVWWASDISASVKSLETGNVSDLTVKNYIAEREKAYLEMDNDRHLKMSTRVTIVEGDFKFIEKSLGRIEKKLMLLGEN